MTKEDEDERRRGSACRWSPLWAHGQMKGRGPERLRSVFHDCGSRKRVRSMGVFPGFQSDVISAPHVSDTVQNGKKNQNNNNGALSQQHLGLGITTLCVAMATLGLVVFSFPSLSLAHSLGCTASFQQTRSCEALYK